MLTKIHGIILSVIRHNDRHNIVSLYTAERGRISLLSPIGKGRTGALRNARLSPLALIETEINFKSNRELQTLGAFSISTTWRNIYFDPIKTPIVFFLSEFLSRILRTAENDLPTWHFIVKALVTLDHIDKGIANFHLAFLVRFMKIAGIDPDTTSYIPGAIFDLRTAEFVNIIPSHRDFLNQTESEVILNLMRINFRNLHLFKFTGEQRRLIINKIIKYYSLHLPISTEFKSLDILTELFR